MLRHVRQACAHAADQHGPSRLLFPGVCTVHPVLFASQSISCSCRKCSPCLCCASCAFRRGCLRAHAPARSAPTITLANPIRAAMTAGSLPCTHSVPIGGAAVAGGKEEGGIERSTESEAGW